MSRFIKIVIALTIISTTCFFLMLGSFFKMISHFSGDTWVLDAETHKPHIAVVNIEGPILDAKPILKELAQIKKREACRGILVRLETPGGAVAASQEIFQTLKSLKTKEFPIVVSMGNTAASGGYYIALAGQTVFANPGTLTGSIGVIAQFPMAYDLMDKVGISFSTIKSGELKDAGSPYKKATPKELQYFQDMIDGTYTQFLDDVLAHRDIPEAELKKVADGRVVTGRVAFELGLVDTLGGLPEAKAYIAEITHLGANPVFVEPTKPSNWINQLGAQVKQIAPLNSQVNHLLKSGVYYMWPLGFGQEN